MRKPVRLGLALGLLVLTATGCSTVGESLGFGAPAYPLSEDAKALRNAAPVPAPVPRELGMELLPPHVVVPGDTLLVQPVDFDSPLRLPPDQPVEPDGTIDLGPYGRPVVVAKTLPEVEVLVREQIRAKEKKADPVTVRLIARPADVYYVLGEVNAPGAFPVTGSDTVLSAITLAGGPTRKASEQNVVLSRPTLPEGCRVVLPVCYANIVQLGDTTTNYQLRAGDRVYVPSRGTLEGLLPRRCQKTPWACGRPQVPCWLGGCPAPADNPAPASLPPVPQAP